METDLDFYTRALVQELRAARRAVSRQQRIAHERRAAAYRLQLQRLAGTPTAMRPDLRLKPLPIAA